LQQHLRYHTPTSPNSELLAAALRYRLTHFAHKKSDSCGSLHYRLFLIIDSGMNTDFLSESGCPGFEDVQDVIAHLFVGG